MLEVTGVGNIDELKSFSLDDKGLSSNLNPFFSKVNKRFSHPYITKDPSFTFMATRLQKLEKYLPGDLQGLAKRCDCFIYKDQVIKKPGLSHPQTIFVSMYKIESFQYFVDHLLPTLTRPFVLILASEDATFPGGDKDSRYIWMKKSENQYRYQSLMQNPYLKACFVENLDREGDKLYPLPLGVLPYDEPIFPLKTVNFKQRQLKALCIHRNRLDKQFELRQRVTEMAKTTWKDFVFHKESCSRKEFIDSLRRYCFCLCVHGGGIDPSPKAWEALAMGCIPIIEHSTLDKAYSRFPVVYIDKWHKNSITPTKLKQWLTELRPYYEDPQKRAEVIKKLSMGYWLKEITGKLYE